ncbi:isopeptide-forming domain-containing fimbrial protein [Shouchella tritolerans]|uniref:isopeptide-forming domain-containing fimbrial protein n=1 Tax=Shouchella tritolerans TaxID=2979466 RepID=UPI0021E93454|nr:isopeptide-forming domain-containing fimbrial protein [Shouchella tritolerans]
MQSKKLMTRRRLLELRKLVIVTMVFLLSLSNFLPYSAQYAQANETPSLSDLELTQDVDGEERKEVEKGATFTFNVDALIPESGSDEGTLTILNQVNKQLSIENVEVVVNEEESDLEATVEGQDVSLELTPEQLDTVAGQHVTLKITAAFQDEVEAGTEIENVAEAFINGELAEKAEPVTVALLADAEATSEEEEAPAEEEAQQEEENAGEESSEEEKASEEEQSSEEEQGTEEEAEGEEESNEVSVKDTAEARIAATDGQWLTHKFDEFSGNTFESLFAADGAAGIPDGANFIRLTPAETLQSGAVFNKNAACPTNEYSFSTGFSFQMSGQSPEGPSDGLTFTLQTGTASQNSNGGGLGYYGIQPSFAVKYDTFLNTVYNDPSENYIGLAVDGSVVNQPGWYTDLNAYNTDNSTNFVLSNGTRYYTWIDYDGLNQNVQVRLGTSPDRGSSNLVLNVDNIDLSGIFNGQPYHAGFTASTGLPNYENHDIYNWYFIDDYSPIATLSPEGGSKQAPSDLELTIEQGAEQGEHNVIITLLDPLGNPVSGASLDELTATAGELTGPNGESVTELVSDEDGKVHAVLKNANPTQDITISATTGCFNVSDTIEGTNEPLVVAEKSVSPEGDVFVGDELTYEVTVKNEGGDVATDTVIEDVIPEGTEYVPGSMKIVNGPNAGDLTDENDEDAGQFDGDKVVINIGDVPNTTELEDGITVQFKVKALSSHVGESVVNKAVVSYKNAETDEEGTVESNEVTNEVIAGEDIDACANPVALVNGSFEQPDITTGDLPTYGHAAFFHQDDIPGWSTTHPNGVIELWNDALLTPGSNRFEAADGVQNAELNADIPSMLYQVVDTEPGQVIYWRLAHRGRNGPDTMSVHIGPVTDNPENTPITTDRDGNEHLTDDRAQWGYHYGEYVVPAGQTKTLFGFKAVSSAGGQLNFGNALDDIFLGTEPCVVAEKSVSPEGEVFEGDELTYEVTVKNNGGDVAGDTVIEDVIPEGTEYVPNSMKIVNGPNAGDLTDENDDDAGHFDSDKVMINIGDVPNTTELADGITVQFKVKALSSHVGESVVNKATVGYKNLLTDEDKTTETNEVTNEIVEGEDIDACANPVALVNGSFEEPPYSSDYATGPGYFTIDQELVPGWQTTDSYKVLEIFNKSLMDRIAPGSPQDQQGLKNEVPHGQQMAELNSKEPAQLYQDVETTPGQVIHWRLAHKGRLGDDTMVVKIGSADVAPKDLPTIETITTGKDEWKYYSGTYTVPADQTVTRFGFEAVSSAGGNPAAGNFLDDIFLGTEPCVVAEKSVSPEGEVFEGDELTYEVTVKNNGGDVAANTVIEDAIPEGTEFVPGSMKILNGPKKGDLTDENDDDAGHFDGDKVIINIGEVPNATELEEGITVQFKVKALSSHVGETVVNKATVGYKNLLTDEDGTTETNEVSNEVVEGEDIDACASPVALVNGSFEEPVVVGSEYSIEQDNYVYALFPQDVVPGWNTTASDGLIELWDESVANHRFKGIKGGVPDGKQVAELNANEASTLYQDVKTTPGQTIYWRLSHQGGADVDTAEVRIGSPDLPFEQLSLEASLETGPDEWKIYSGTYTVPAGQTTTRFAFESTDEKDPYAGNILDDIFLGTEPCVVAEKSVSPEGEVFEGDELTYEVTVKNNGGDVAADTVIEDAIPEGTEYVPESMKIVNGPNAGDLTDENDDDAGHFDGDKVIINIGDVPNTTELEDGITVQFKVKALSSHVGESVVNKATVGYKNLLTDEDGTTETNEVSNDIIEREDIDACARPVALINGSFEEPLYSPDDSNHVRYANHPWFEIKQEFVPGWQTTDSTGLLEIMNKSLADDARANYPPGHGQLAWAFDPAHGQQFAELNSKEFAQLYQDVETTPGQTIYWRLAHRGVAGSDTMAVKIGPNTTAPSDLPTIETITTDNNGWQYYSGTYKVPAGQTITRFGFEAVSSATGAQNQGNVLDEIFLGTEPCVVAEKSVSPEGEVAVGDELTYEVTIKNNGGDVAANTVFEDAIPEGTEYVPGSIKILTGPKAGDLTDADGDDAGHFDGDKVIINLGDLPNTTELPDGVTVQFKVKTISDNGGEPIVNKATVGYKNLLTDEDGSTETNEVETPVQYNAPKTESEKSAELLEKADGNTDADNPEVGDTLKYTIQTRNTVENSLITNLTIRDAIPEGLEYVSGTLKVNGEAVTDEKDDDEGHVVDGEVFGSFGDVTNTEWHTLEFQVIVSEGQAGNDIENVAVVDGDNLDEPDEPREEVKVYPREPKTESKKSAKNADDSKEHYEVGDTVVYTIEARNTVSDSLLENLKITDVLPEGLTFVEGSLKASDGGTGNYEDGKVTAEFGEVTDTEWRTVTFEATINAGYSGEKIKNVALVEVPNIEIPDEPETEIDVDPKQPKTESEKSAELLEKADGNTDADNPEVGDTLKYTIQTRNTIEDSLITNLTIRDAIPEGLEYVPGTLKVNGEAVTDEKDDDEGHVVDGEVFGSFGDVTNTEWHTLEFQVIVSEGQAGNDIENVAVVDGDNLDEPDEPREEVKVYPREPKLESKKSAKNADESKNGYEVGDTVVYTIETRNTVSDSVVEDLRITDKLPEGLAFVEGSLQVSDGGTGNYEDGTVTGEFGDVTDTEWRTVTFEAKIESGFINKKIKNVATVGGGNIDEPDEPETEVDVDPKEPKLESKKSAKNADESKDGYEVGDTVVYTIETRNTVSDSLVEDLRITDKLPEGLAFVEGSLQVSDGGTGNYEDGTVTGEFGDVTDTEWRTVTFEAKIESGFINKTIKNVATVGGGNIDEPDEPETEVDVDPKEPKLESKKSAKNADESKDGYEVGDTVVYTIETRNTVSDSLVEDLRITDKLPEGLAFVEGSLQVSDGGTGNYEDGTVTGEFGDVTDTEWRTVTFEAKIESGFINKTIKNVATVGGGNIDEPDEPETDVDVDPKQPKTESEKSAELLEKADGNTDADNPEVGDTLKYTIQTRNTIEDSLIANLTIRDVIPEGLEYVSGTLKVNGEAVTDEDDSDQGHVVDGEVFASFGDVTDTEWRTVEFHVIVSEGQAGKDIENVAVVDGDNIDEPDEPREEVKVYPREPKLESKKSAKNADDNKEHYEVGDTVVYTIESRNSVSDSLLENLKITDVLPEGLTFVEGSLKVSDGGTGNYKDGTVTAEFGEVKDTEWRTVTFEATIDSGYSGEKIKNVAVVEVPNLEKPDEPDTEIVVDPKDPKTESEKSAKLLEKADGNTDADNPEVGDTLVYTIQTRNTVEDSLLANLTIRDAIPAGLEYVPGTLKVNGEAVTDENDDDKGHVVDGEVFASFGNVTDTEWHTVEFHVIVSEGQAGKDIENVAVVDGDNIDEPDEPREEVKVYPREPKLEYEKTAKNADEAKDRYEAGDTVVYTIRARNTVSDSLLDNMTFTDELPEGLTFVEGSLEASHGGKGSYEDGKVTAEFGEVKDTEWRTITFEATINAGYAEETIRNVAVIEVPNIGIPGEPDTEIVVDPKQPKLESKKSAKNADENKDGYEVGDTVVYTIETRNTIEDSLVEDLRITDQLPEGLAFVEGSLKVSEGGEGSFEDGTVTATFGNVPDTEWRTVTFEATIEPGFANKTVKNVATVDGGNIDDPDKPEQEVDVDPKQPKLESKKSAKNADESKDGYEVGDTVVYTIEARNTVEDSAVEDLTIIDQLPEGLAFVEGSLKVSEGGEGSFEDGTVTATFGNVTDTEWRTVTFEATIESGTSIKNVATVNGGNIDDPDKPEAEIEINEPPTPPTPDDGDDKEDPVDPTPGDKPEEPKPGNDGTDKPQVPPGKVGSGEPQDKGDATPGDKSPSDGTKLPKTATSTYTLLLIGASLLVLGAILWFVRRKKAA